MFLFLLDDFQGLNKDFLFQIITVHVQLVFHVTNLTTTIPAVSVSNIFQGTTVNEMQR